MMLSELWSHMHNKLLKCTPAAKGAASAGQPTLRFGCPLAKRYTNKDNYENKS